MNEYKFAKTVVNFARDCVSRMSRQQLLRLIDVIDGRIDRFYCKKS
ncbi:MAG: hypothetical protein NC340_08635 [Ruminococcus flavefaciens]|nr:hypothetical protein [Ruminococcus flavefaciens]MCM1229853.1 hypothetical protein [Ruminococcus flavefaciens]